jgi:aspartate carbamoyltransferase catalytic subunit
MTRHLLSAADLSRDDALLILDTATELARLSDRPIKKLPTLRGRTSSTCSSRTRPAPAVSFEAGRQAAVRRRDQLLGQGLERVQGRVAQGHRLTLAGDGRRRRRDPARSQSGAPHRLSAGWTGCVINAGDGTHEHPTQALLDAYTMRRSSRQSRRTPGGDRRRRAAQPGRALERLLLRTLGAEVTLVAPPTLLPVGVEAWPCGSPTTWMRRCPRPDAS